MIVLIAAAPPLLAFGAKRAATPSVAYVATTTLAVKGIDCEACAVPLRIALAKVGGFHDLTLDIAKQTITVGYTPAAGRLAAYVAAINELGYEANLPGGLEAQR